MTSFAVNPALKAELAASGDYRAALRTLAQQVADTAAGYGQEVAPSYQTRVEQDADSTKVLAETRSLSAAGWIEYGTPTLPARSPLRRAAEANGLRLQGGRSS